jgi:tRNA dimethylallyltransferase
VIAVLVGATGTGKTAASLELVARIQRLGVNSEIVNADAMQVYRGMDIGTAKLPASERRGIPHHLIDVCDVTDEMSVAAYQRDGRAAISAIIDRGAVPIVVGGSGLYVASLVTDFQFPGTDPAVRARWEAELTENGLAHLVAELARRDPGAAEMIDPQNARRVVRALEIGEVTGQPVRPGLAARSTPWLGYRQLGLAFDRAALVERLDARVRDMWRRGLLEEVAGLRQHGLERGRTASRAIGYAQALDQLAGRLSEAEARDATASLTRRYARRQVSWFRRDAATEWVDALDDNALDAALTTLAERCVASMAE